MRGRLVTFEGPEGSGKTTQMEMLRVWMEAFGYRCVWTREPGGTEISEQIRRLLLDRKRTEMAERTELLLYLAGRAQNVRETIRPALDSGAIVLCDRFHDSTLAYQAFGRGLDLDLTRRMCSFAAGDLWPDLTFLLDIAVEVGLGRNRAIRQGRARTKGDRLEAESADFHQRVREGYLRLAEAEPERFAVIDAAESVEIVHQRIVETVKARAGL